MITQSSSAAQAKIKNHTPFVQVRRDTDWTVCLASVFLEIALSTKGGAVLFTLHDPNPDTLWIGGLGFVCFDFSTYGPAATLPQNPTDTLMSLSKFPLP